MPYTRWPPAPKIPLWPLPHVTTFPFPCLPSCLVLMIDVDLLSQASTFYAMSFCLVESAAHCLAGHPIPSLTAGVVLRTLQWLWVFGVVCVFVVLLPTLTLHLLAWLALQFTKAFIVIFPPIYLTGYLRRQGFVPCTDPSVGLFETPFFAKFWLCDSPSPFFIRRVSMLWEWISLDMISIKTWFPQSRSYIGLF